MQLRDSATHHPRSPALEPGKSTLLNLITGGVAPSGGVREVGETTVFGYLTQYPPEVRGT